MYPLILFVIAAVIFQVNYLNKALFHFSTSIVTPLNFVFFSTSTLLTSAILYQGFNVSSAVEAITIILGFSNTFLTFRFMTIVIGVSLLFQYNLKLSKLAQARWVEDINDEEEEIEKALEDGPLALMNEIFPFDGRPLTIMRSRKPTVSGSSYIRSEIASEHINQTSILSKDEYVRSTESNAHHVIQIIPLLEAIVTAEPAIDKQFHSNNFKGSHQSSSVMHVGTHSLVEIPEEPVKQGSNHQLVENDVLSISTQQLNMTKADSDINPPINKGIVVKNKSVPEFKVVERVVILGDIESDYTEDDSSSYQESSVSDSSAQPITESIWKPSFRGGRLPSLRKNA
jgi:hypothetical protein